MYLTDYHSHTEISPDSTCSLINIATNAAAVGMKELCITDHCDLINAHGQPDTSWDWAPSVAQIEEGRKQLDGKIILKLGIELGMPHLYPKEALEICAHPQLDFVIGSIHNASPAKGGGDYFFAKYPTLDSCYESLDDYFESMKALVDCDIYDVLGHIIYPLRYMHKGVTLDRYYPQIKEIFRTLIANGRGIELNTYRGRSVKEWRPMLELYHQCGGTIITVGADAHMADSVGRGVFASYKLIQDVGFKAVTTYEKRTPIQIPFYEG